jgi:hypothetical protein
MQIIQRQGNPMDKQEFRKRVFMSTWKSVQEVKGLEKIEWDPK